MPYLTEHIDIAYGIHREPSLIPHGHRRRVTPLSHQVIPPGVGCCGTIPKSFVPPYVLDVVAQNPSYSYHHRCRTLSHNARARGTPNTSIGVWCPRTTPMVVLFVPLEQTLVIPPYGIYREPSPIPHGHRRRVAPLSLRVIQASMLRTLSQLTLGHDSHHHRRWMLSNNTQVIRITIGTGRYRTTPKCLVSLYNTKLNGHLICAPGTNALSLFPRGIHLDNASCDPIITESYPA
ncbi:hypothetical protein Cgig2_006661 [Carnegiea gigantea]|uniref:Uncharacterized protein n=1 Tax=Carnegiea gigantea TaxID=171969 RepID=A0A9Q1Q9K2_9CARY|nr:hypothetical protein Cgig2_006661 [Carnegiea gigantea]